MSGERPERGRARVAVAAAILAIAGAGAFLAQRPRERVLRVAVATSLAPAFDELRRDFEAAHPGVRVEVEAGPSVTLARRIADLARPADLIAVADAEVFDAILLPKRAIPGYWEICGERLGIEYSARSAGAAEITAASWHEVLRRPGVRTGRADPDAVPAGYRTLVLFRLAELHYGVPGLAAALEKAAAREHVRGSLAAVGALVEAGEVDYGFDYRSSALARGLEFLELPREIDLSDRALAARYARVEVEVAGSAPGERVTVKGAPIRYAVALRAALDEPALARDALRLVLGPRGREVLARRGFAVYDAPGRVGAPAAIEN